MALYWGGLGEHCHCRERKRGGGMVRGVGGEGGFKTYWCHGCVFNVRTKVLVVRKV